MRLYKSQIFDPYASTFTVANINMINKEFYKPTECEKIQKKPKERNCLEMYTPKPNGGGRENLQLRFSQWQHKSQWTCKHIKTKEADQGRKLMPAKFSHWQGS